MRGISKANSEHALYEQIARYLQMQYPDVIFHFDYPDLFIAKPMYKKSVSNEAIAGGIMLNSSLISSDVFYCGLYIELKKDGTRLKKKDGEWASEHIAEQANMLEKLRKGGHMAEFACGFDEAKEIIDKYLKNNLRRQHEKI